MTLTLDTTIHDPSDPMGKVFFNTIAAFAEFEADLIRMRTRESMEIAMAKGKLRGKRPKLSEKQQKELWLAEVFPVSGPTVYRTLIRPKIP